MTASSKPSDVKLNQASSNGHTRLPHQIFHGKTWHSRLLPSVHKFTYPYRYWGINISALAAGKNLPKVAAISFADHKILKKSPLNKWLLFSGTKKALQQFYPDDYLQGLSSYQENSLSTNEAANNIQGLEQRLAQAFTEQAGSVPTGDVIGMLVCRNAGIYFSPVNFYIGFDSDQKPSHLLAEVSNTPWDKRHYYGFLLKGAHTEFCHNKDFHVSPFNPIDQIYRWQVTVKNAKSEQRQNCLDIRIAINISDERGDVLKTGIKMSGLSMTANTIRDSLRKNPLMNVTSLTRIYWHAFKLYAIKKVPYINYDEKLADSEQQQADKKLNDKK